MNEFFYIVIGIFGAILGSFASAVIPRIKAGQDFVTERSECPNCKHELGVLDLFPILSYICLLGKCRYCKSSIPPYHFLLELTMASGFVLVASQFVDMSMVVAGDLGQLATLVFLLAAMFITVVFCAYDLLYMEIPDEFMIPFLTITLIILTAAPFLPAGMFGYFMPFQNEILNLPLQQALLGALPIFFFFYLQIVISNERWMGGGDLRIAIFMGFIAGAKIAWLGLFLAYIIGSIIGMMLMLLSSLRQSAHNRKLAETSEKSSNSQEN